MTTYYVATNGNDGGNGSASSPWRTITHATQVSLKAGDEVVVRSGTYNEAVSITKGGSAAGDITFRAEVPGEALIRPPAGYGYSVNVGANYVTVDGFDIKGPTVEGHGIQANWTHHVSILNNVVHDSGASGIQFNWSEFITVEGNETYNNAKLGWFSGISIFENRNITGDTTTTGYRTIVRNNISHDNYQQTGLFTDGNGIIIDDFQSTHTAGYPNYTYSTLVDGNLVYENGGKGIAVHWSDKVTVSNNTAWHNNLDNKNNATWRGELSNQDSKNNTWINNIAVADTSVNSNNTAIGFYGSSNFGTKWNNNLTFNGTAGQASLKLDGGNAAPTAANGNLLGIDPKFVNAGGGDFHLQPGSKAIDAGTSAYGVGSEDLDGGDRTVGPVDIGAYEAGSGGTANHAPTNLGLSDTTVAETAAPGTVIGQLTAVDSDGDPLTFAVSGDSRFTVNASGQLLVAQGANLSGDGDREVPLTFTANDGRGGVVSAGIDLTILDSDGTITGTDSGEKLYGTQGSETMLGLGGKDELFGYGGDDELRGGSANDVLRGSEGHDILIGGTGSDRFVFTSLTESPSGSAHDEIEAGDGAIALDGAGTDGGDKIGLWNLDANLTASGNQTFVFGSIAKGGLSLTTLNGDTLVRGNVDDDAAFEFEIVIHDGSVASSAYTAGDFVL